MLKKTINYKDLSGNPVTGDFYFNLNEAEIAEMESKVRGGVVAMINTIINAENNEEIFKTFKDFILKAYGEKSEDNIRFIKSEELSLAFSQTDAYNQLVKEFMQDATAAAKFFDQVIPKPDNNTSPAPANN